MRCKKSLETAGVENEDTGFGPASALFTDLCVRVRPPHLRGRCLDGRQVALQCHAPVVVERGHHPGQVGLHQLLPLAGNLLLQRLQHRLEVLEPEDRG